MGLICVALPWFEMLHYLEKHSPLWSDVEAVAPGLPHKAKADGALDVT